MSFRRELVAYRPYSRSIGRERDVSPEPEGLVITLNILAWNVVFESSSGTQVFLLRDHIFANLFTKEHYFWINLHLRCYLYARPSGSRGTKRRKTIFHNMIFEKSCWQLWYEKLEKMLQRQEQKATAI